MADSQNGDGAWFAPKCCGYGAGLPIAWQGWALLTGHIGLLMLGAVLLKHHKPAMTLWVASFALLPLPLYMAKTRGGWRWHWPWDKRG